MVGAVAAVALVLPAGSASAAPPPGFDLFETDPASTQFSFVAGGTTIAIPPGLPGISGGGVVNEGGSSQIVIPGPGTALPPSFFGPGSDPFVGQVHLGGVPIGNFQGRNIGDADTIVRRLEPAPGAPEGVAPIQLVRLSLQSVDPITVTYEGGQRRERWMMDVSPSPSTPSQGEILIRDDSTFDSQLLVVPLLTFTRLSDGRRRSLDLAALLPGAQDSLLFQQQNAPWRAGCLSPALAVSGLNDGFCPGFTPKGRKQLTEEQALLARHGVYPAQPALEHFECYSLGKAPFRSRGVALRDQFGGRGAKVYRRGELCTPVEKNGEPFVNWSAHLQCYKTNGPSERTLVAVQNQFGSQRLLVKRPRRLCLPTAKRALRSPRRRPSRKVPRIREPIDHFQCYSVERKGRLLAEQKLRVVKLRDQFGVRGAKVGPPFQLCAPVEKRHKRRVTRIEHPVKHLVCYRLDPQRVRRRVMIRNQFEWRPLRIGYSQALCVPSNKLVLE